MGEKDEGLQSKVCIWVWHFSNPLSHFPTSEPAERLDNTYIKYAYIIYVNYYTKLLTAFDIILGNMGLQILLISELFFIQSNIYLFIFYLLLKSTLASISIIWKWYF